MKLLFFDDFRLGVLREDVVIDVSHVVREIPHTGPNDLISGLIERFGTYRSTLEKVSAEGKGVPVVNVQIRPPLPRPVNIDCMAVNYMEDGTRKEPAPINAFLKSPNSVIGNGDTMVLPDVPAAIFEGEAELALIIGKRGTNVPAARAMEYIFGYTNFIDGSARGLPPAGKRKVWRDLLPNLRASTPNNSSNATIGTVPNSVLREAAGSWSRKLVAVRALEVFQGNADSINDSESS